MPSSDKRTSLIHRAELSESRELADSTHDIESAQPQQTMFLKLQSFGIIKLFFTTSFGQIYVTLLATATFLSLINIGAEFGVDNSVTQWILIVFQLMSASFGTFAGTVASRISPGLLYKIACCVCFAVDLLISLSPKITILIALRVVSGGATACIMSCFQILQPLLAQPAIFKKIFAIQILILSVCTIAYPFLNGFISDLSDEGWRWIYGIQACLAGLCALMSLVFVPRTPKNRAQVFDIAGFVLFLVSSSALVMFCSSFTFGWLWYVKVVCLAIAVLGFVALALVEMSPRTVSPLFPLQHVLRRGPIIFFTNTLIVNGTLGSVNYLLQYLLAVAFSMSTSEISNFVAILSAGMCIVSVAFGGLIRKTISPVVYVAGIMLVLVGVVLLAVAAFLINIVAFCAGLALFGFGIGFFQIVNFSYVHVVSDGQLSLFAGLIQTFNTLGQAIFTVISTEVLDTLLEHNLERNNYSEQDDPLLELYRDIYGNSVAETYLFISAMVAVAALLIIGLPQSDTERGQKGFRERRLPRNRGKVLEGYESVELVEVQEAPGADADGINAFNFGLRLF